MTHATPHVGFGPFAQHCRCECLAAMELDKMAREEDQ